MLERVGDVLVLEEKRPWGEGPGGNGGGGGVGCTKEEYSFGRESGGSGWRSGVGFGLSGVVWGFDSWG